MYGGEAADIGRHALHAVYLSFPHPQSGNLISLYAPLPADMAALCPLSEAALKETVQTEALRYFADIRTDDDT